MKAELVNKLPELKLSQNLELLLEQSPLKNHLETVDNPATVWLGRALAQVWLDFEKQLSATPIINAIESETVTLDQYKSYLRNMRQQVSQGGRWLSQTAASMQNSHAELRSALIRHAAEEHLDFKMLENDFIRVGGTQEEMVNTPMNIGSQALSAYILHEASQPNPVSIFGSVFIVEGLGSQKAGPWSRHIQKALGVTEKEVKFLHYHGVADEDHYKNLIKVLSSEFVTPQAAIDIRRVAKVTGRLYALQLEELDNF